MKLKILVKIIETLFGVTIDSDEPRADMYLPVRLLAIAFVCLAGGIACAVYVILTYSKWAAMGAAVGILLGIFAIMCWKNQAIRVLSDEEFAYTTMFGNTRTYRFAQIEGLRRNNDSLTLFVAGDKVHIESMAILTERLAECINAALQNADGNE